MGFFSNATTVKKALWLYEAHRCSACGAPNAAKQKILLACRVDSLPSQQGRQNAAASAEQRLSAARQELIARAADRGDIGKFSDLHLDGKCRSCGHREPWSRPRIRLLEPVFNVLVVMGFIAIVAGIVGLFMDAGFIMLAVGGGIAAAAAGVYLLQRRSRIAREKAVAALDGDSLPFLTADEEAFHEQYPDLDPAALEKIEASGSYQVPD